MDGNKNNTPTPHGNRKEEDAIAVENNKGSIERKKPLEINNGCMQYAQSAKKNTASLEKTKNVSSIKEKDQNTPSQHGST
eukprot:7458062-Ditylum_brightwellii.AAC.1